MEIWKDICGYEGLYKISNLGRVKSLQGYNGHTYYNRELILRPTRVLISKNYERYIIKLTKNKKSKTYKIHRLVAEAFIKNEQKKPYVNHIDGNPLNNNVENLEWCTQRENIIHSLKFGNRQKKYNKDLVIYDYVNSSMGINEICKKHNISKAIIRNLIHKNNIKHSRKCGRENVYNIDLSELLDDFKKKLSNKEIQKKYKCSADIVATRKYQFKKRGLL
jgi:hypothetical protein